MIEKKKMWKNKPNLVIATDAYLPRWDGIARFLYDFIILAKNKFNITVIAPKFRGKKPYVEGIEEILMPLNNFSVGDYDFPKVRTKEIKDAITNADLVWTHTIGPIGRTTINISKRLKKRTIAYIHSIEWELFSRALGKPLIYNPLSAISRSFVKKSYSKCDMLMMPSHTALNLFRWYGVKNKAEIFPLGINTKKFIPPENKIEAKKRLGFSPNSIMIGYCGRLAHEKDLKTLVRAFLRQRDIHENIKLVLVGGGLEELRLKFSKINGVVLTGSRNNVVPFYQAMDIYVLPSLTETTSLSTLEAMSCEIPVLATPVGEVANYIKNNRNGFKFSKGNSFELSQYLKLLIDDDRLRNKLGKNARKTVLEKYSWDIASKKILDSLLIQADFKDR